VLAQQLAHILLPAKHAGLKLPDGRGGRGGRGGREGSGAAGAGLAAGAGAGGAVGAGAGAGRAGGSRRGTETVLDPIRHCCANRRYKMCSIRSMPHVKAEVMLILLLVDEAVCPRCPRCPRCCRLLLLILSRYALQHIEFSNFSWEPMMRNLRQMLLSDAHWDTRSNWQVALPGKPVR